MKVLGLAASLRSLCGSDIAERAEYYKDSDFNSYYTMMDRLCRKGTLSNSDALLAYALWAAAKGGAEVEVMNLRKNKDWARFERVGAVILSTPVYFGDYSSPVS